MDTNKPTTQIDFTFTTSDRVTKSRTPNSVNSDGLSYQIVETMTVPTNFREKLMRKLTSYSFMLTPKQLDRILCIFEWAVIIDDFYVKTKKTPDQFVNHFRLLAEKAQYLCKQSSVFNQTETLFQVRVSNKTQIVYTGTPEQIFSNKHVQFFENFSLFNGENLELHLQKPKSIFKYCRAKLVEAGFVDGINCRCFTSVLAGRPERHYVTITIKIEED